MKDLGNNYDLSNTMDFFRRHWALFTVVFVVGVIASTVVSLLITPQYRSSAILFPTNSNRMSKAILADRYSMDFMDYGSERDCEYAIQILMSQSMEDDVCRRFNLMEHYEIPDDDPHKLTNLHKIYQGNISIKRTKFIGVEIAALDKDPQLAADIVNYMVANYDSLSSRIQSDRSNDAYKIMCEVCADMENSIRALEDTLKAAPHREGVRELISAKTKELAELQTRMSQTKVDLQRPISYKYWIDKASPADKKYSPKRSVIVVAGSVGILLFCIFVVLVVEQLRKAIARSKNKAEE